MLYGVSLSRAAFLKASQVPKKGDSWKQSKVTQTGWRLASLVRAEWQKANKPRPKRSKRGESLGPVSEAHPQIPPDTCSVRLWSATAAELTGFTLVYVCTGSAAMHSYSNAALAVRTPPPYRYALQCMATEQVGERGSTEQHSGRAVPQSTCNQWNSRFGLQAGNLGPNTSRQRSALGASMLWNGNVGR